MPVSSSNPLDSACFPLVPFANRIADARFDWNDAGVQLQQNFPLETSALHGTGWQRPWQLTETTPERCVMAYAHAASDWPWDFQSIQTFELRDDCFLATLELANCSGIDMPAGLGLHPYFRRRPETRVFFEAGGIVLSGRDQIPTGEIAAPGALAEFRTGSHLPGALIDHCYTDWNGEVVIEDDLGRIEMRAVGASYLHVYAPPGTDILCLEPVTHPPDALNRWPEEMTVLEPGRSTSIAMRISASLR
ncbi:aldose 1-epimerase [Erythrobacter sp. SDW2]|nr:aldose 1-epimerase [Erythrobacter sp. SDW2]